MTRAIRTTIVTGATISLAIAFLGTTLAQGQPQQGSVATLADQRSGDSVAAHISVSFALLPPEWVNEQNAMDPIWAPLGNTGVNYYAYGRPKAGKNFATHSDPGFSLYQAWFGTYVMVGEKPAFGSEGKGDQCKAFTQLAEFDQRSSLDAMGDPRPLAEPAEQRRFLTIPVEGSERTACSFEMKSHSDLSPGETPLAKHMGMPTARDWQDRFAAFHDVTLHVIGAWSYDARRDLTVIVYGASSAFPSSNGASKGSGPALDASLRRMTAQVRLAEAARGKP
jgi:hypothetical protein